MLLLLNTSLNCNSEPFYGIVMDKTEAVALPSWRKLKRKELSLEKTVVWTLYLKQRVILFWNNYSSGIILYGLLF